MTFEEAVREMRKWQQKYFELPKYETELKAEALKQSKHWERYVDRLLRKGEYQLDMMAELEEADA